MVVRISKGRFDKARGTEVEQRLRESERSLRPALQRLAGLRAYWVAIDHEQGFMTNTSLWDTREHAAQMSGLKEMLALRSVFEGAGVVFEVITNHDLLWELP
ncbi:MAG TPA: hypothetical protein VLW85_22185 [Myxococcales bacterium]|nr:hypothetical protein [Myxococcales bacterium]